MCQITLNCHKFGDNGTLLHAGPGNKTSGSSYFGLILIKEKPKKVHCLNLVSLPTIYM